LEAGWIPIKKLEIKIPGAYSKLHRSGSDLAFVRNLRNNWTEGNSISFQEGQDPRWKLLCTNAMAYVRGK